MPASCPAGHSLRIRFLVPSESNCLFFGTGGKSCEPPFTSADLTFLEGGGMVSRREGSSLTRPSQVLW